MKINKVYNKKEKRWQYQARFQLNKQEYYPVADSRTDLIEIIDRIRSESRREKNNLPSNIAKISPNPSDLFARYLPTIENAKHRQFSERVFKQILQLLPADIKIKDFKSRHFQVYIDNRQRQINIQSSEKVQPSTINKEMYAIRAALKKASLYYSQLEDWQCPPVPRIKVKRKRRERLVDTDKELGLLLNELRKERHGKQTDYHISQRKRLADELEFRYETGLRRKEVVSLKKSQYFAGENCLRTVERFKTETVSKFIPLSTNAVKIIESRLQFESDFIFSENGKVKESDYRTMKTLCEKLQINYGRYKAGGFVPHDLRHNFVTEVMRVTDIETARTLTGHSSNEILTYLHTDESRQREAISKRENKDSKIEIVELYKGVKRGKIKLKTFINEVRKLGKN
jgi:integrase